MRIFGLMIALAVAVTGCGDDNGGPVAGSGGAGGGTAGAGGSGGGTAGTGGAGGGTAGSGGSGGGGLVGETMTGDVPMSCRNSFTQQLSDIPLGLSVTAATITANSDFQVEVTPTLQFTEDFLNAALVQLPTLTDVDVGIAQATIAIAGGATGANLVTTLENTPCDTSAMSTDDCTNIALSLTSDTPPTVTEPLTVELQPVTGTVTAGASGTQACFNAQGTIPAMVSGADPATDTHITVAVLGGAISVALACEGGTTNDNGTPDNADDDTVDPNADAALLCFDVP